MSQYPSPYYPPPGQAMYPGYNPYAALLSPARRAGIMMFILGGLSLLCGSCVGVFSVTDFSQIPAEQRTQLEAMQAQLTAANSGITLHQVFGSVAVVVVALGIIMVILGFLVRRGGQKSLIAGLCVAIPLALFLGMVIVLRSIEGNGQAAVGSIIFFVPVALLLRWLIQGIHNAKQFQLVQAQYQMQYNQYQQNAQMYGQTMPPAYPGYGGGYSGYGGGYGAVQPGFIPGQGGAPQQQQPPPPPPSEPGV